jgi:hypothetical protein
MNASVPASGTIDQVALEPAGAVAERVPSERASAGEAMDAVEGPARGGVRAFLSEEQAVREVFLSPRVVDREAFNDYASTLRRLIESSVAEAQGLRAAAEAAQQAQLALRDTSLKHQPKIDAAARALGAIEPRLAQAERTLQAVAGAEQQLAHARGQLELIANAKLAEVNIHLERLTRSAEDALTLARQRAAEVEQDANLAAQRTIEHARQRAEELASQAVLQAERRVAQLESGVLSRIESRLEALIESRVQTRVSERVEAALRAHVSTHLGEALDRRAAEVQRRIDELTSIELPSLDFERAERVAASVQAAAERAEGLAGGAAARAQVLADEAFARVTQLESLTQQAVTVKGMMSRAINEAAEQVDALLERAEGVKQTAVAIGPACARAEERINASLRQMEVSAETARAVVGDAGELVSRLGVLVEQIKPWAPLLLTREGQDLPPVIQDAVERARERIMSEASEISSALNEVSARMARYAVGMGHAQPGPAHRAG